MEILAESAPLIKEVIKEGVKFAKSAHASNKKKKEQVAKQMKVVDGMAKAELKKMKSKAKVASAPPVALGIKNLGKTGGYSRSSDKSGLSLRVKGSDYLGTVVVPSATGSGGAGNVIYTLEIAPLALANTRLASDARTFEFYKFQACSIRFTPTLGTQTGGSLVGFMDLDQLEDLPAQGGENNLRIGLTHPGKSVFRVWEPARIVMPTTTQVPRFYVDPSGGEARLTTQGKFFLLLETPVTPGTVLGTLEIDYDVLFSVSQFSSTPLSGEMSVVVPGGTVTNNVIFGTSAAMASYSTLGIGIDPFLGVLTFPPGTYFLSLMYGAVTTSMGYTAANGLVVIPIADSYDGAIGVMLQQVVVPNNGGTLYFSTTGSYSGTSNCWISMFPLGMSSHKKISKPSFLTKDQVADLIREALDAKLETLPSPTIFGKITGNGSQRVKG